jgi:DNA polymerase-3 subunit gamma/tau
MQYSIKYRPSKFSEVFGQPVTKRILTNSILMNKPIKAMLLSGLKGTGKTTLARIYAKAVNCENFTTDVCQTCHSCLDMSNGSNMDVFEFDAASNNGVDFVRDLDPVFYKVPTYKKTVIIFDEAHMFSTQAQSALLKVLEEVPNNLCFIFCTTEPERLEDTIRTRCLSMPLRPIISSDIEENLKGIVKNEGLTATDDFYKTVALSCNGSLRDAQQMLYQAAIVSDTLDDSCLENFAGIITISQYRQIAYALCSQNLRNVFELILHWYGQGFDLEFLFIEGFPKILRDFSIVLADAYSEGLSSYTGLSFSEIKDKLCLTLEHTKFISEKWKEFLPMMQGSNNQKLVLELFFVAIVQQEACLHE